ncbi:1,4-alpha-glucan branching protein [Nocardia sp. NPDC052566]|uniref:maltokinase N-terminal cap-like domain-containing protein n=1 Tax=Nocardia sp. NPDC052566 TaxID=3364330 RepID=UPI0037CBDB86
MVPTKQELLTAWLPTRSWYRGDGAPVLRKAGGFRLDDPAGAVGIELMVITDNAGERPVGYLVPFGYRGAPLDGAADALIGTSEHGVLGTRWIYDGTRDPVVVGQLIALLAGAAQPQDQNTSDAPDTSVEVSIADITLLPTEFDALSAEDTASDTIVTVTIGESDRRVVHINRALLPVDERPVAGSVTAPWRLADTVTRSVFVTVDV